MRKRAAILAGAFCLALSSIAQTRDAACERAKELIREEKFSEAASCLGSHYEEAAGKSHRLEVLFMAGECYYMLDDYRSLYTTALRYWDTAANTPEAADSLPYYSAYYCKLAGAYYYGQTAEEKDENFLLSEQCYKEALDYFKDVRNDVFREHDIRRELAQLYYKVKDYGQAAEHLDAVEQYYLDLDITEDKERISNLSNYAMCNARRAAQEPALAEAVGLFETSLQQMDEALAFYKENLPETETHYYEALRRKGKILQIRNDRLSAEGSPAEAVECYRSYIGYQCRTLTPELLSMDSSMREQRWLKLHNFLYDACRVGREDPGMVYDLVLFSKGYLLELAHNQAAPDVHWQEVQQALGPEACALEFVEYFGRNDEKRLGCLVLRKGDVRPSFIDVAAVADVMGIAVNEWATVRDVLASSTTSYANVNALYTSGELAACLWSSALMSAIGNATQIYFAPDGFLHQLALEYMLPDTTRLCHRLSSTRVLCQQPGRQRLGRAMFVGGVDFSASISPTSKGNDIAAYRQLSELAPTIDELPGSKKEVDTIFALRQATGDKVFCGGEATDERFASAMKEGYSIVHMATHGIYYGERVPETDLKPLIYDNSMSENALILAGASQTLHDYTFDPELQDGILSAGELSKLHFQDTDLVVLSACQTALGRITADGVYGIQRALKQAGAKTIILSLWEVYDNSTYILMKFFYEELQNQEHTDIQQAFSKARRKLMGGTFKRSVFDPGTMTDVEVEASYDKPIFANSFILIDAR